MFPEKYLNIEGSLYSKAVFIVAFIAVFIVAFIAVFIVAFNVVFNVAPRQNRLYILFLIVFELRKTLPYIYINDLYKFNRNWIIKRHTFKK